MISAASSFSGAVKAIERNQDFPPAPGQKGPLRVLLVEDSEFDAILLMRYLRARGYDTSHLRVESQPEMEKALNDQKWDVVLCDYQLPRFGVLPALALIKRRGLQLPFIVVSGAVGNEVAVDLMRAGAHEFIRKDRLNGLVPAIERERQTVRPPPPRPRELELAG